jgi:signal transduction histidine kinase
LWTRAACEPVDHMTLQSDTTEFAPAERALPETISRQSRLLADVPLLRELYDAVNEAVVVLNQQRQIVFCNKHWGDLLGVEDANELCGLRPGEAIGCIHSRETAGGCGTTQFCSACGAVSAIMASLEGRPETKECHILRSQQGDALDLLVSATPLALDGEAFTIFAVRDVGHENRRKALERIFFHDVMNTVAALQMLLHALATASPEKMREAAGAISGGLARLVDEITSQRDLLAAESNDLLVRPVTVRSMQLLQSLVETYGRLRGTGGRTLAIDPKSHDVEFRSDMSIVSRVLGNMIKNAVEASGPGDVVTVGCECDGREVRFWVHNKGFMPKNVQLQLFQRSFSTKGAGRGLGAYSMKLLTERYLKGRIDFSTSKADGTTFTATYPMAI